MWRYLCAALALGCSARDVCPDGLVPDYAGDRCVEPKADPPPPPTPPPPRCAPSALAAWTSVQNAPELPAWLATCAQQHGEDIDGAFACARERTGLTDCLDCARAQFDCGLVRCTSACSRDAEDCRRCQCDAGCVDAYSTCARADLSLCEGVHGRAFTPDELRLGGPFIYRRKSLTGFTRVEAFSADASSAITDSYAATAFSHLLGFSVAGVDYLLEFMGQCGDPACLVRISPVLADGTLGPPAYTGQWSAGWDVFTTFKAGAAAYLLQHKTGSGASRGTVRVLRIEAAEPPPATLLSVRTVYEANWARAFRPTFSHLRAFALGKTPYLLRYQKDAPSADILRVDISPEGGLGFTQASYALDWTGDWDIVETFAVGGQWYLLQYDRDGRRPPSLQAQSILHPNANTGDGLAILRAFRTAGGGERVSAPLLVAQAWPAQLIRVHPLRTAGGHYLLRQGPVFTDALGIPSEVSTWRYVDPIQFAQARWDPSWDLVTIVGARQWGTP